MKYGLRETPVKTIIFKAENPSDGLILGDINAVLGDLFEIEDSDLTEFDLDRIPRLVMTGFGVELHLPESFMLMVLSNEDGILCRKQDFIKNFKHNKN